MSIALVMLSSHLILWLPLLLPSIFPSIRDFSNESAVCIRWPNYWSFSFSFSPFKECSGLIFLEIDLLSRGLSRVFSSTTVRRHQFFVLRLLYCPALTAVLTTGKIIALTVQTFVSRVLFLLFNTLSISVSNLYSLDSSSIPPVVTTKTTTRQQPMSSEGQN